MELFSFLCRSNLSGLQQISFPTLVDVTSIRPQHCSLFLKSLRCSLVILFTEALACMLNLLFLILQQWSTYLVSVQFHFTKKKSLQYLSFLVNQKRTIRR